MALAADPRSPEGPPDPMDPGRAVSPHAALVATPPVDGSASTLDVETLYRLTSKFTLSVDTSVVGRVDAGQAEAIALHLAAEPGWRVAIYDGVLGAAARMVRGAEAHLPWDGYHVGHQEVYRMLLRFEPWPAGSAWATSPVVCRVPGGRTLIDAATFFLDQEPYREFKGTALSIEGEHLWFDLYEARLATPRVHTADELSVTLPLLDLLRSGEERIRAEGYHAWFMPRGEPRAGSPALEIESPDRGQLSVRAWVNPGEPGWTWVRVLDSALRPWEELAVAVGTRERIGWARDPDKVFYLQGTFPVPRGAKLSGTAEVWFQADRGGPPRRLLALPVNVPRR